jgi:hypothetical protein
MQKLYLTSTSPRSGRRAVLDEEIDSIWVYLLRPAENRPEIACWVLNTPEAPQEPEFAPYRARSAPPPLPARLMVASPPDPRRGRWSFRWSEDGDAVAVLLDDQPLACVLAAHPRGYARFVQDGAAAWALPWDEDLFATTFTSG